MKEDLKFRSTDEIRQETEKKLQETERTWSDVNENRGSEKIVVLKFGDRA